MEADEGRRAAPGVHRVGGGQRHAADGGLRAARPSPPLPADMRAARRRGGAFGAGGRRCRGWGEGDSHFACRRAFAHRRWNALLPAHWRRGGALPAPAPPVTPDADAPRAYGPPKRALVGVFTATTATTR